MKTKLKEKINIVTLGCSKNLVDSEVMLTQLKGNNKEVYHQSNDINPDVVIINTCGFIDNAKQESIDTILRYAKEKEEGNRAGRRISKQDTKRVEIVGCVHHANGEQNVQHDKEEVVVNRREGCRNISSPHHWKS